MEKNQPPPRDPQNNYRKHERSTKSSGTICDTRESRRSGSNEPQLSPPLSSTCPSGLLISDKSPKGENLLEGQDISGMSSGGDIAKGLLESVPYWSVNSSYHCIPISALPPKKRYLRQLQLTQASEVRSPALPVAVLAQVPLIGSNNGASLGQKSNQENSLGPIYLTPTRWWNYHKRSSDDVHNTEKNNGTNSQKVGKANAGKKNKVEWGYGLVKYEKEKRQGSYNIPIDGDNADRGTNSKSLTATMDCPATMAASSLGSNMPPGIILTNSAEGLQKKVQQKDEESRKFSHDNAFLGNPPSCELDSTSIQLEMQKEKENLAEVSAEECVASELSMSEKEYVAADVLAQKFDSASSLGVSSPFTCFGSQVEGVGLPKMDKPVNDDSVKNVSLDDEITEKEEEKEWTDDEQCRFMKAMNKNTFDLKSMSDYVGTRSIRECNIFFSKFQRPFGTHMIHEANENAAVEGQVRNSTPDNGVTHIWSAIDSESYSMDNV